jgi:hypothetical protein
MKRQLGGGIVKTTVKCVLIVILCTAGGFWRSVAVKGRVGSSHISSVDRALAVKRWPAFITEFRVAVKKRDRAALRGMIAIPFKTQVDGELGSADQVFKWLGGDGDLWNELQREVAPGAKFSGVSSRTARPQRCATGIFCFEFGTDEHWRLSSQEEND